MHDIRSGGVWALPEGPDLCAASPHRAEGNGGTENGEPDAEHAPLTYRLCRVCLRAVPTTSGEQYCVNDGARLLETCPHCRAAITSPYARYCAACGTDLAGSSDTATREYRS